ncbi:hypothetical protein Pyn_00371 [Prunus yedoensis var. nudiflora]|uniref:Uncharacterized protein n=1 Tax=Prunus yedoensis var. nudiflora TaxID=2094558 RepID=A0A314XZ04_PRUYE|nr:hypothetical protein Pyn_00371 [Prunus yedoensis var. nudiflora]
MVIPRLGEPMNEEFPPSPSDHQSILVSLSSRCVWKGTVCERSHLFRIKYYGSFDKPLGRFLRDHLFDLSYQCHSCEMPSEAHVHCYTHRREWIQKETDEVVERAELLFSEVLNALRQIAEKRSGSGSHTSGMVTPESRHQIAELEGMLQKEKVEFEELLQKTLNREARKGQPVIDILEINRLRRQLLFQSYMWDHRLIYAANLDNNSLQDGLNSSVPDERKPVVNNGNIADMNVATRQENVIIVVIPF